MAFHRLSATVNAMKKGVPLRCLFFLGFLSIQPVTAAPGMEQLSALDFGTLAVVSNGSVSTLELSHSGRVIAVTGGLVVVAEGAPGRFRLTGFPPDTVIDVTADEAFVSAGGTGLPERIKVADYTTARIQTSAAGEAEVQLGASFSTSGNSGSYEDAPYTGDTQLRFDYWDPGAGTFVSFGRTIDLVGAIRSNLQLSESTGLNFGTLFAQGASNGQASLKLLPDGRVDISQSGDARLLSLSKPLPAKILVSGAAPDTELTIDLQSSDVLVKHSANPTGPHFVLGDMTASPSDSGRTDQDGFLEISVGGTLSTQLTAGTVIYPAGSYEGSFSLLVSY